MKLHLQSDIHLEMSAPSDIIEKGKAEVIIAAGDIGGIANRGELEEYFYFLKDRTEHVIWTLGNHEFYYTDYQKSLDVAMSIANKTGVNLMDIECGTDNLEINGTTFWGSTLWTDFNNNDEQAKKDVKRCLNDYRLIKRNDGIFETDDAYEINKKTREMINWDADVIISHHCPIVIPHPEVPFDNVSYGFCNTNLEDKIKESKVKVWAYGHTHHSIDMDLAGTRLISNCRGYQNMYKKENTGWKSDLIIEV